MAVFKVGDRVVTTSECGRYYANGCTGVIIEEDLSLYHVKFDEGQKVSKACDSTWWAPSVAIKLIEGPTKLRRMEAHKEAYRAAAHANDPATSKGKRKINKYEQVVINTISVGINYYGKGWTGKELAAESGHPLNCITPRFAPLRRKGLIKDSGVRRDKQIVWVLT